MSILVHSTWDLYCRQCHLGIRCDWALKNITRVCFYSVVFFSSLLTLILPLLIWFFLCTIINATADDAATLYIFSIAIKWKVNGSKSCSMLSEQIWLVRARITTLAYMLPTNDLFGQVQLVNDKHGWHFLREKDREREEATVFYSLPFSIAQNQTLPCLQLAPFLRISLFHSVSSSLSLCFYFPMPFLAVTPRVLSTFSLQFECCRFRYAPCVSITEFSRAFKKYITWNEYKWIKENW